MDQSQTNQKTKSSKAKPGKAKSDKAKFIKSFFEALGYFANAFFVAFEQNSFEYKMLKIGGHDPKRIWQGMRNLENRGFIKRRGGRYFFTPAGRDWAETTRFQRLEIREHPWDKKWRVVIFDIPESLRSKRSIFRSKLKALNFCMIQKSVFAIPFRCEKEITGACDYLEIGDYVNILTCESLGEWDPILKKQYDLK